jgi:glucans biosynthesis protein C
VLLDHLNDTHGAIGDWDYHDPATNLLTGSMLTAMNGILMACGMGIFFLISAYFTPGSYDHKGGAFFLRDRLVRLGLPLLLYDLLIHPLVAYLAGGLPGSYWSFCGTYLL